MIALVGLGNPTEEYTRNRHNVGFMFVDYVAKKIHPSPAFKFDKYMKADTLILQKNASFDPLLPTDILFVKPQTFMNRSGDSVKKLFINYKLALTDLVVVHDDLDIAFGTFKISNGVGPKLHNGIESIENALQSPTFLRLRIGVDNRTPDRRMPGEAYVLQNFTPEEQIGLDTIFENGIIALWQQLKNS